jgi:acyl carrier protein
MDVAVKIREYIRDNFLFGSKEKIDDHDSLLDRGIIDSTGAMELVTFLETEFQLNVNDQDLVPENLDNVSAITAFVNRKLAEQRAPRVSAAA